MPVRGDVRHVEAIARFPQSRGPSDDVAAPDSLG